MEGNTHSPKYQIWVYEERRWATTLKWDGADAMRRNKQWWAHEQTSGRRGQHKVGTGSSPALSIVRARAHNKRADSRARSAQQEALLRSEGTTCGNAIPLKEHKREQGMLPQKATGSKTRRAKALQFYVAEERPPQSRHKLTPTPSKLWGEAWTISSSVRREGETNYLMRS